MVKDLKTNKHGAHFTILSFSVVLWQNATLILSKDREAGDGLILSVKTVMWLCKGSICGLGVWSSGA